MENLVISKEALQKILNYLAGRPYVEVFELVQAVQGAKPALSAAPTEEAKQDAAASN